MHWLFGFHAARNSPTSHHSFELLSWQDWRVKLGRHQMQ